MKKWISVLLVLILVFTLPVTALAADEQRKVTVRTSIEPTYTVTIPADVTVQFNETSTSFGKIQLDKAQLDPGYVVKVALSASGKLKNQADTAKTIAYSICTGGTAFQSAQYEKAGENTALTIDITEEAWKAAFAGNYSDTVTFTISYEKKS